MLFCSLHSHFVQKKIRERGHKKVRLLREKNVETQKKEEKDFFSFPFSKERFADLQSVLFSLTFPCSEYIGFAGFFHPIFSLLIRIWLANVAWNVRGRKIPSGIHKQNSSDSISPLFEH